MSTADSFQHGEFYRNDDPPVEWDEDEGHVDYEVDGDPETYIGDGTNGCSYLVGTCRCCGAWHIQVVWECEHTIQLCLHRTFDTLIQDGGPYMDKATAIQAAINASIDWCIDNGVDWTT